MPAYWKLLSQIGSWRCDWSIDMTAHIAIATSFVSDIIPKFQIRRGYPKLSYWQVLICPKHGQLWYVFFEGYSTLWMISWLVLGGVVTFNTKVRSWCNLTMFWDRTVAANVNNLSWCDSQPGNDVKNWSATVLSETIVKLHHDLTLVLNVTTPPRTNQLIIYKVL